MSNVFLEKILAIKMLEMIKIDDCFHGLTQRFFALIKENLTAVKSSLAESLYAFEINLYREIKKSTGFDDFVKKIIKIYTSKYVYRKVNLALRRSSKKLEPTGNDLLLSLYTFMLQTFLLNFDFPAYNGKTYRLAQLSPDQLSMYDVGVTFVWMSFTSSSKLEKSSFPGNVKFIFDNDSNSNWKPRDISSCSQYPNEAEMLYPAGAKFRVTAVNYTVEPIEINLKLKK